jgi:LEA14-like dessication related protein
MKSLWLKVFPFLACLLITAGCGSNVKLGNILVDITAYTPTTSENRAQLTIRYTNENIFPIAISETFGKLYLNNEYVGKVTQNEPIGIPQLRDATRTATLVIEKPEVLKKALGSTNASIAYRLESTLRFEVSEDHSKITTAYSGQLETASLRAAPTPEKKN